MTTAACEACGEQNPPGTQFCLRCNSFLAWEEPAPETRTPVTRTRADSAASAEELIETRVMPKIRPGEPDGPGGPRSPARVGARRSATARDPTAHRPAPSPLP